MRMRSAAVVACALIAMAAQLLQGSTASAESDKDRAADRAAIEKLFQQDIAATVSRDAAGLTYANSPDGEANQGRGTVLTVLKKLPNGRWKCFRAMGTMETSQ